MKPSLTQSLELARDGDAAGYSAIYAELSGSVTRFAYSRRCEDPAGMTNEVFLAAFRMLDSFDGDADGLRGWIFTIARNKAIDDARRRARRPLISDVDIPEEQVAAVEDDVLARLQTDWVEEQLSVLTDDQREVLLLRFIADLTIPEISRIMDREIGAVKALQRRALRRLEKEILYDECPSHTVRR